jgi:hypothetical protein
LHEAIQFATRSDHLLLSFEEIKIITQLKMKSRQNKRTQGPLKWLIHVLQHETEDAGRPGVDG